MPAAAVNFNVAAKDTASGTLDRINARLASVNKQVALARAPFDRLSQSASKFARLTGIGRIASSIGAVGRAGLQAFQSVTRIVEPLAAIGGAASIAGMVRLATAWAEFGSQLGNAAARAGLTSDKLLALENAGRLAGVSAEATAGAMTTLRDNMVNAVAGTAPQVIGTLQALGLSLDDARRYAADTTKALPELADKIAAIKDPTVQALVATRLFGSAGEAMLPWLRKGSAGIADYTARAERYGTINAAGVAAANQLREAQVGLTLAVTGLGYAVAEQLAPSLGPLLNQMANWIAANRDWIAQGIGDKVRQFAGYLQQVDWAQVGADVMAVVHGVERFVDALGGVVPAAELVVGFFAVAWAAKMMAPILMVANALRRLPTQAALAARESNAELGKIKPGKGGLGGGVMSGLASMSLLGLLEGVLSGDYGERAAANLDERDRLAANPPAEAPDTRRWWERFYKPGPGLLDAPATAKPVFPGGSYRDGPGAAPSGPAPNAAAGEKAAFETAQQHAGEGPAQVNAFLRQGGTGIDAAVNAWCAAFVNSSLKSAGLEGSHSQVATSFLNWGKAIDAKDAAEGDVLVQARGHRAGETGGHVGFATGEHRTDPRTGHEQLRLFSGNYGNRVSYSWEDADGLAVRRAPEPSGPTPILPTNAGTVANPGSAIPAAGANGQINVGLRFADQPAVSGASAAAPATAIPPMKVEQSAVGYGNSRDR